MTRRRMALLLTAGPSLLARQRFSDFTTPQPLRTGDTLIVGFVGGWHQWDDERLWIRKVALDLRARRLPGVYVETAANHQRKLALQLIRRAFPRDPGSARVILYGQSFGGAAVVKLARELHALHIPVMLTVQVDSVGRGDGLIPPNVAAAVNLYQRDSWPVRGQASIRAQDPSRTKILGNLRYHYRGKHIDLSDAPLLERIFGAEHAKMDFDPEVWSLVEKLILNSLGPKAL